MLKRYRVASLLLTLFSAPLLAETTLTLYTSQPNDDAQMTVTAFEKQFPQIKVKWIRDGTTKLLTRLQAEQAGGGATPDVLLIADSVSMESLKQQQMLASYHSAEAIHYDPAMYDAAGYYYGTKLITTGIAYHSRAPMVPASWHDLTRPEVKNMTAMPSPLYSGAALIHLATLVNEPQFGWNYYQQLKDNGLMLQNGNGGVLSAIASGAKAYGVMVDFMAIREKAKGAPIEFAFVKEGNSIVTEPVAMLKNAKNPAAAHLFIDFLLSEQGQNLVLQQGYLPGRSDMPVPQGFPPRDTIKLMKFDAKKALTEADSNKQKFSKLFGNR